MVGLEVRFSAVLDMPQFVTAVREGNDGELADDSKAVGDPVLDGRCEITFQAEAVGVESLASNKAVWARMSSEKAGSVPMALA